jgi:agmatinase
MAVLGVDHATPYRPGVASHSAGAPRAIRRALVGYGANRDHYDFDLGGLPPIGAVDCGDLAGSLRDAAGNRARITAAVRTLLDAGAVPIVLGGDDSVPIPMFRAWEGRGPLTIVQIDAHVDWRDEVRGERFGYSSTMRRASEMPWVRRLVQIGMRGVGSARPQEVADARAWGAHLIPAAEVHHRGIQPVLDLVPAGEPCIVTLDCDGLDPSIVPAVIAPAPGGLVYQQVLDLLQGLAAKVPIVAFDIVELVPARDPAGLAALTAGRLVCNAMAAITTSLSRHRR